MSESYWAEFAMLPMGLARDVRLEIAGGRFVGVTSGVPQGRAHRLPGVVLPGFANDHSHAFHRALRGRTHHGGGTFWTWREGMYAIAGQLDPDSYLALARATYAEMALAGITSVGEFHYLHHGPDGRAYDDPNAMAAALRQAAREAGVRLTLLDTLYLSGGLTGAGHSQLEGIQRRFGDRDAAAWGERVGLLVDDESTRVGAAMHSVRAVPFEQLQAARDILVTRRAQPSVVHAHVSEQPAENAACAAFYGRTPIEQLDAAGLVDPQFTAVHATHLTPTDIATLANHQAVACFCPTTERDLADGIGPARELSDAGVRLSLGSDQHAVIDPFEEARALESHERLTTLQRGRFTPAQLLAAATDHASIGWPDVGQLVEGLRADFVAVRLDSPRTAGSDPAQMLLAATAADVDTVVRDGAVIVADGRHRLGDVGRLLTQAIDPLWRNA